MEFPRIGAATLFGERRLEQKKNLLLRGVTTSRPANTNVILDKYIHVTMEGEQAPVQIGQFILAKNLGIGAFGKVGMIVLIWKNDPDVDVVALSCLTPGLISTLADCVPQWRFFST